MNELIGPGQFGYGKKYSQTKMETDPAKIVCGPIPHQDPMNVVYGPPPTDWNEILKQLGMQLPMEEKFDRLGPTGCITKNKLNKDLQEMKKELIQDSPTLKHPNDTPTKPVSLAIDTAEHEYPQTTQMFKDIMNAQYELWCKKMLSYGASNISLGSDLQKNEDVRISLTGIWFRMADKVARIKQLVLLNKENTLKDETINDTYVDLSIYSIIAQIVKRKVWGK